MLAGAAQALSCAATASRSAAGRPSSSTTTKPTTRCSRWPPPASTARASSIRAPRSLAADRARQCGIHVHQHAVVAAVHGRHGSAACASRTAMAAGCATSPPIACCCRAATRRRPRSRASCGATLAWREDIAAFTAALPAAVGRAWRAPRAGCSDSRPPRATAPRAAARDRARTLGRGGPGGGRRGSAGGRRGDADHRAVGSARPRQGLRRPAERRDHGGRAARAARGLRARRAHEALHHPRHGDRPGPHRRAGRQRPCSPQARGLPLAEVGPSKPRPYRAAGARSRRWRAGRCASTSSPSGDAAARLASGRRRHLRRRPACGRGRWCTRAQSGWEPVLARGARGAPVGRPHRRLDARQDRRAGRRTRRASSTSSMRTASRPSRRRPCALRHHAARGRHAARRRHHRAARAGAFPVDDDDRQRRGGARTPGVSPAGVVSGIRRAADRCRRSLGAVRGRRTARARGARRGGRGPRSSGRPAFPFMAAAAATIAGVAGRVFRISFSGELAYELAVPARDALPVWLALLDAGRAVRHPGLTASMH